MNELEIEQERLLTRLVEIVDVTAAAHSPLKVVLREHTASIERVLVSRALKNSSWNVTKAAKVLKTSRKNLQNKIKSLGLEDK